MQSKYSHKVSIYWYYCTLKRYKSSRLDHILLKNRHFSMSVFFVYLCLLLKNLLIRKLGNMEMYKTYRWIQCFACDFSSSNPINNPVFSIYNLLFLFPKNVVFFYKHLIFFPVLDHLHIWLYLLRNLIVFAFAL